MSLWSFVGILAACELLEQLSMHRVIPKVFLRVIPRTGSPYVSVLSFVAFGGILYASAGASLTVISEMFSLVWLTVMSLFPISLLLLRFNRGRLPRSPTTRLSVIVLALTIAPAVFAGNIAYNPKTAGYGIPHCWRFTGGITWTDPSSVHRYFSAYFIGIVLFFSATQSKVQLLRWLYWVYDQYPFLHEWRATMQWGEKLISYMRNLRRQPVCILVKTDEVRHVVFQYPSRSCIQLTCSLVDARLTISFIWSCTSVKTKKHRI